MEGPNPVSGPGPLLGRAGGQGPQRDPTSHSSPGEVSPKELCTTTVMTILRLEQALSWTQRPYSGFSKHSLVKTWVSPTTDFLSLEGTQWPAGVPPCSRVAAYPDPAASPGAEPCSSGVPNLGAMG